MNTSVTGVVANQKALILAQAETSFGQAGEHVYQEASLVASYLQFYVF
jgi:hypothetical protein